MLKCLRRTARKEGAIVPESFLDFISGLNARIGIPLPDNWASLSEVEVGKRFLEKLNAFRYYVCLR